MAFAMFTYKSMHAVILLVNATEDFVRCHASRKIHRDLDSQLMVGDHPPEPKKGGGQATGDKSAYR